MLIVWLSMCLLAVLGSQGIVVKCTAAVFFLHGRFWAIMRLRARFHVISHGELGPKACFPLHPFTHTLPSLIN